MNSTEQKEKNELLVWAKERADKNTFETYNAKETSYYIDRQRDNLNMMEYDFSNINELKTLLDNTWDRQQDSEIRRLLTIAIMKEAPEDVSLKDAFCDVRKGGKIPDYIYVF